MVQDYPLTPERYHQPLNPEQRKKIAIAFPDLAPHMADDASRDNTNALAKVLSSIPMIKGDTGERGEDGKEGGVGPQGPKGDDGIDGKDGDPGIDGKNGRNGSDGIDGRDGKDGSSDSPKDIASKLNTLKEAVDVSVIKGALGKKDLEDQDKKVLSGMQEMDGRIKLIDQRYHGGGLSKVTHDTTLTGSGTPSSPLSVVGGGGGVSSLNTLTGAVILAAGANITLTPAGNTITIAATGGGSQTPWTSDIDGGGFDLSNVDVINANSLILPVSGSATNNAIEFGGGSNTGLYSILGSDLNIAVSGTDAIKISSTGTVHFSNLFIDGMGTGSLAPSTRLAYSDTGSYVFDWSGSNPNSAPYFFDSANSYNLTGSGAGLTDIAPGSTGDMPYKNSSGTFSASGLSWDSGGSLLSIAGQIKMTGTIYDQSNAISIKPNDRILFNNTSNILDWTLQSSNANGASYWFDSGNSNRITGDGAGLTGVNAATVVSLSGHDNTELTNGAGYITSAPSPAGSQYDLQWNGGSGTFANYAGTYDAANSLIIFNNNLKLGAGNLVDNSNVSSIDLTNRRLYASNGSIIPIDYTVAGANSSGAQVWFDSGNSNRLTTADINLTGSLYANGTRAVADGTYTVGLGLTTNGTITIVGGVITAIQQAS